MDAIGIGLIAIGAVAAAMMVFLGWSLDRRSQRVRATKWMANWHIRNRVLADLWRRVYGPLRLRDDRSHEERDPE